MKEITPIRKHHPRRHPGTTGTPALAGLTGTRFALSEVLESDTDGTAQTRSP